MSLEPHEPCRTAGWNDRVLALHLRRQLGANLKDQVVAAKD